MGQKYYYRIKFNPGFDRQMFNEAKTKGVLQRDFEDIRKSLDGKEALLGVEGEQKPVADGLILSRYTPEEAFQYIEANAANWKLIIPQAEPKVQPTLIRRVLSTSPRKKAAIGAAIALTAAALYTLFALS